MKRLVWVLVMSGGLTAAALMQHPTVQAEGTCGAKGQPSCPLQGWMEKNMDPAVEKNDTMPLRLISSPRTPNLSVPTSARFTVTTSSIWRFGLKVGRESVTGCTNVLLLRLVTIVLMSSTKRRGPSWTS